MELIATINDSAANVRCIMEDGNKRKAYTISLESFINSLSDSSRRSAYALGEMPQGYVNGQLSSLSSGYFTGAVVLKVPASVRMITYYNESFVVPVPELCFKFFFDKGKKTRDEVVAVNENGRPCCYPFTNVYDDRHICWGSAKLPVIATLKETEQFPELFLRFPCSSHLSPQIVLSKAKVPTMGELFKKLEGKKKFPQNLLFPLGFSLEEFCKF